MRRRLSTSASELPEIFMRVCEPIVMGAMGVREQEERASASLCVMDSCSKATTGLWSEAFRGDMS